jgi:Protein of unknown function (DUF2914)
MRTRNNPTLRTRPLLPLAVPAALLLVLGTGALAFATPATSPVQGNADNGTTVSDTMANTPAAPATDIRVEEVAVCRKIEERAPVAPKDSFASNVENLYCFTDVRDAGTPQRIFHRWYVGDTLVSEIPMEVQGTRWRCWSEKTIAPGWTGPCHVEIVTEAGDVIGQTSFSLVASATPSPDADENASDMDEQSSMPQDQANPQ